MISPTLAHIETHVIRLPIKGVLRWGAHSQLEEARHVLVHVTLSDGAEGWAEAPPRPTIYGETVWSITSIIQHELAPRLLGLPADQVGHGPPLTVIRNNHTALAALDMAVQAALAQAHGLSLAQHLGARLDKLRVSYILGIGTLDECLAEARSVYDQGVRVLKVKVGRAWAEDVARIRALQAEFGGQMALYADANETLEAPQGAERLAELRDLGLLYCEEPLPVWDIKARVALRAQNLLPLIADDSAFTLDDLRREAAFNTFDVLNIKPPRTGFSQSRLMAHLAAGLGKPVMVGSQAGAGLATGHSALMAAALGTELPCELSFPLRLQADVLPGAFTLREGYLHLVDLPPLTPDASLLRRAETNP